MQYRTCVWGLLALRRSMCSNAFTITYYCMCFLVTAYEGRRFIQHQGFQGSYSDVEHVLIYYKVFGLYFIVSKLFIIVCDFADSTSVSLTSLAAAMFMSTGRDEGGDFQQQPQQLEKLKTESPSPERVSSAADAMLQLARAPPDVTNQALFQAEPQPPLPSPGDSTAYHNQQHIGLNQSSIAHFSPKHTGSAHHGNIQSATAAALAANQLAQARCPPVSPPLTLAQHPQANRQQQQPLVAGQQTPYLHSLPPVLNSPEDDGPLGAQQRLLRKQREFMPDFKKDETYWSKRRKNNEAAKRSREKRRVNDIVMGQKILELTNENNGLREELHAIKAKFGLPMDQPFVDPNYSPRKHAAPARQTVPNSPPLSHMRYSPEKSVSAVAAVNGIPPVPSPSAAPHVIPTVIPVTVAQQLSLMNAQANARPQLTSSMTGGDVSPPPLHSMSHITHDEYSQLPSSQEADESSRSDYAVAPRPFARGADLPALRSPAQDTASFHLPHSSAATNSQLYHSVSQQQLAEVGVEPISPISSSPSGRSLTICTGSGSASDGSEGEGRHVIPPEQYKQDRGRGRKGVPHKLRHKYAPADIGVELDNQLPPEDSSSSGDAHQGAPLGGSGNDNTYVERRRRNNAAARKCRENRRIMTELRKAKSNILENENNQLKSELRSLAGEVAELKRLMEQKKLAREKGEPFNPPQVPSVAAAAAANAVSLGDNIIPPTTSSDPADLGHDSRL